MRVTKSPVVRFIAVMLAMALSGASGVAYANHRFTDSGTNTFFHDAIAAIADAGCATGFNDGTFREGDNPNRGQFAFWLNNCGGRIATAENSLPFDGTPDEQVVADVDLTVGGSGTQLVYVQADGQISSANSRAILCGGQSECIMAVRIVVNGISEQQVQYRQNADFGSDSFSLSTVVPVAGGTTPDIQLVAANVNLVDNPPGLDLTVSGQLTAMQFPFGGTGLGGSLGP
ncbi:MAG: hypothetical protein AAGK32_09465 [Actinomycetota bacterium]